LHRIHRQARIHRENLLLSTRVRDTRDTADPWDTREPQGAGGLQPVGREMLAAADHVARQVRWANYPAAPPSTIAFIFSSVTRMPVRLVRSRARPATLQ
jgi:hypothetical protein